MINATTIALVMMLASAAQDAKPPAPSTPPGGTAPPSSPPSAPRTSPPSESPTPPGTESPSFASPQQASDAFVAASAKKDWKAMFRCFAPEARDLAAVQLLTMAQFNSVRPGKATDALSAIMAKHSFDSKAAWKAAQEQKKATAEAGRPPDGRAFVATYAGSIKDKEAFVGDLLRWADEFYAGSRPIPPDPVVLKGLTSTDDRATGTLSNGTGDGWRVLFRKLDGRWMLVLPEEQFEPSGWNDGFLFDYLDAIHHWRF